MQLKIEGATTLYIKKLCEMYFNGLVETGREFMKAFPDNLGCFSGKETASLLKSIIK